MAFTVEGLSQRSVRLSIDHSGLDRPLLPLGLPLLLLRCLHLHLFDPSTSTSRATLPTGRLCPPPSHPHLPFLPQPSSPPPFPSNSLVLPLPSLSGFQDAQSQFLR